MPTSFIDAVQSRPFDLASPGRHNQLPPAYPDCNREWTWRNLGRLVIVILLFAAGLLQFGLLKWYHAPASERVNNGAQPTFFAFHVNPNYTFSEDFHLYYVRAKRIEKRGWTDSLFYHRNDERQSYVAPLQVLLCRLAIWTEGKPDRYSLFMFAVVGFSWTLLLVAARCWLPSQVHTGSILLAVLVTVLCEAFRYPFLGTDFPNWGQWPLHRGLRMSSSAWTSPLLLCQMLGLTWLVFERRRRIATMLALTVLLMIFVTSDNWSFAVAWVATGLTGVWLCYSALRTRLREVQWPSGAIPLLVVLLLLMLSSYVVHLEIDTGLQGDTLTRAGCGLAWQQNARVVGYALTIPVWFATVAALPLVPVLIVVGCVPVTLEAGPRKWTFLIALHRLRPRCIGYLWLALLPVASVIALNIFLKWNGMEYFLRNQMYWRADYCLLFIFILVMAECCRILLARSARPFLRSWPAVVSIIILCLFLYHNYRINWFVKNVAGKEFFITADAEKTIDWLKKYERQHGEFELATASIELNYLVAFHTNADLLLPSGFPYHDAASNREIHQRAVKLLRLFGASQTSWMEFTKPTRANFLEVWRTSRIRGSGRPFFYHLFHRWAFFTLSDGDEFYKKERTRIGDELQRGTNPEDYFVVPQELSLFRLARNVVHGEDRLRRAKANIPHPDIILDDPVSRALGKPDLINYRRAATFDSIRIWLRKDLPLDRIARTNARKRDH